MTNNISFSRAESCLVMDPMHSNPYGNVHGGELMKIMDIVAGIAAIKHARGTMVHLVDGKPAKVPELVITSEEAEIYKLGEKKYKEIKSKYRV